MANEKKSADVRGLTGRKEPADGSGSNYDRIDITDDYMFSTVMQDPELCTELLEYLLPDCRIRKIKYIQFDESGSEIAADNTNRPIRPETQKTMNGYFGVRGVRLDAYLDDGRSIYNVELQATRDPALPERSRLYQSHIDISQLKRGEPYDQLRPCYVIFLCTYDPFGHGFYRYSFRDRCDEDNRIALNDGTYKLFFNTAGHIGNISPKLRELLRYMNDTRSYPVNDKSDDLIRRIDRAVHDAKMDQDWRDSYMIYQIKQREAELRGESKGRSEEKIELVKKMLQESLPVDMIARISGLSASEISELK